MELCECALPAQPGTGRLTVCGEVIAFFLGQHKVPCQLLAGLFYARWEDSTTSWSLEPAIQGFRDRIPLLMGSRMSFQFEALDFVSLAEMRAKEEE